MICIIFYEPNKGAFMKTVRTILAILILMMVPFAISAGGQTDSAGGDTPITFWTFNELHQQFYEMAAEEWNKDNPTRKIELQAETFPYNDMHNKLLVALQSGVGAPAIVDIEISKFPNFLKGQIQLEPMNEYVNPVVDQLVKSRLDIYAKDGNYYGLPFHVGAAVMYYNVEIMDAAGVNIDDIKTWDDYVQAGLKVKAATGKMMASIEHTQQWTL
jgi:arabinosaccharide transport system substrate-binding protein